MRIIFFGSPGESADSLRALIASGHDIVAVYSQPDRTAGRGRTKTPTPVKVFAGEHDFPIFTPDSLRDNAVERDRMSAARPDVFVVVAYGRILPVDILQIPPMGVVNVHPSLLPKYRGPSPVVSAILDGQSVTGVTIMLLDRGMDTGPILAQSPPVQMTGRERGAALQAQLFKAGTAMLPAVLQGLEDGTVIPTPQDDTVATTTRLLKRSDGEIDWSQAAEHIDRMVRAYDPWPGAFTLLNGKGLKILEACPATSTPEGSSPGVLSASGTGIGVSTGNGSLSVTRLQLEGRQAASAAEFLRGHPGVVGTVLG
ncbi:MAG: methionyl-tRNA formyltransferase [Chloroflexi bacterium]|nr:methionyl-tRNA formyltransferase [Chloroflexota bacterium]